MRVRAVARGEQLFARHPAAAILLPPSWIAGINRARPALYLSLTAASAAVWAGGIGLGAYFAGRRSSKSSTTTALSPRCCSPS
jgi:membrane protein DedA with SNARE-associated domain